MRKYLGSEQTVKEKIEEIERAGKEASSLDQSMLTILEMAQEMMSRGFGFLPCDLYKSQAAKCVIEDGMIRLPFTALGGTGETAAKNIVETREDYEFLSIEDLKKRAKLSSTVMQKLEESGCLAGLSQSNQISLFDL